LGIVGVGGKCSWWGGQRCLLLHSRGCVGAVIASVAIPVAILFAILVAAFLGDKRRSGDCRA